MSKKTEMPQPDLELSKSNLLRLLLFCLAFMLYINTIGNRYALDDEFVINNNSTVQKGVKGLAEIFSERYTDGSGASSSYGYRPVVKAVFAVEYELFGENPAISHFINVLLYALSGVLLFNLLKVVLRNYTIYFPFIITVVFIAHPLHTEVVASLKNRDLLISFAASILALRYYLKYNETGKVVSLAFCVFFFLTGYFSKADAVTILAVMPLVSWFFFDHKLKRATVGVAISAISVIMLLMTIKSVLPEAERNLQYYENPLFFEKDLSVRTATAFYSLLINLKLLFFPHPLVYYYGFDMVSLKKWPDLLPVFSMLIHSFLGIWAIIKLKEKHLLSFIILFYLITVSLYSNLVVPAVGIVAERFLYTPSLAFCFFAGYLFFKFSVKRIPSSNESSSVRLKAVPGVLLLLILVAYCGKTVARNRDWKDKLTLYSADIAYQMRSVKALDLLASELLLNAYNEGDPVAKSNNVQKAVLYYTSALQLYPEFPAANNSLASIYCNFFNQYEQAVPLFERAVKNDSSFNQARFNLAVALDKTGRKANACQEFEKLIQADPKSFPLAYSHLGRLYAELGDQSKGIQVNMNAMAVFPGSDLPLISIGQIYLSGKDTATAISYWEKALSVYPGNAQLASWLSQYFRVKGDLKKGSYYQGLSGGFLPHK